MKEIKEIFNFIPYVQKSENSIFSRKKENFDFCLLFLIHNTLHMY